jgi:hypothetical protein
VVRPFGLGRLSLRDSDGVVISPWETLFSLSFFPVLRFDQPRDVRLAIEGTLGRVGGTPNVFTFESSSSGMNGEPDLRPSRTEAGVIFGLIETCWRAGVCAGVCVETKLRVMSMGDGRL